MKKFIIKFLSFLILSLFCIVPVFAEEQPSEPTVYVSNVTGIEGDTVVVTVSIKNSPGIQAMSFTLSYDTSAVEFVKFQKGGLSDNMYANHADKGYLSYVNCEMSGNVTYNGTIFSVTFKVKDDVKSGVYPFKVRNIAPDKKGDDLTGCFANREHTKITPIIENGSLSVGETCKNSGHKMSDFKEILAPSCEGVGTKSSVCQREGCGHTRLKEIPAKGHSFSDEWTIDIPATAEAAGVMSRHCKLCTAKKDEISFSLEVPKENEFENQENEIVAPEKWDILEEIIEEEKHQEQADKNDSESGARIPKAVKIILIVAAVLLAAIILGAIIFLIIFLIIKGVKRK